MRLPPLNALRAFEAAARHGSFARAAEELNVSAGAVSRHVKLLEAHLGVPLFLRHANGLEPTNAATAFRPKITASFEAIARAAAEVAGPRPVIRLIASPTFANRCLIPRLPRFKDRRPETNVSVSLLISDIDEFVAGEHDCGMATFHEPRWPAELRAERIKGEELTPLCAPSLLGDRERKPTPEELSTLPLLRIAACPQDWPNWLELNGGSKLAGIAEGPTFETGELAIRAAVEGLGVIVMDRLLVERELETGRLVDLFPDGVPWTTATSFSAGGSAGRSRRSRHCVIGSGGLRRRDPGLGYPRPERGPSANDLTNHPCDCATGISKEKSGAVGGRVVEADLAAVGADQVAGDGEAEAGAARRAEPVKDERGARRPGAADPARCR